MTRRTLAYGTQSVRQAQAEATRKVSKQYGIVLALGDGVFFFLQFFFLDTIYCFNAYIGLLIRNTRQEQRLC